jgi:uncharacterized phage protein (TIGR01671 family)
MNREILYRGKRVDNGDWGYGYAVKGNDKKYQMFIAASIGVGFFTGGIIAYEVIPETVGQFTGILDKNGKKIFEGDIVESPNGTQGFIEWQNEECAFLVNIGDDWQTMDDCPYEVIGNIYDNKEEE